MNKIFKLKKGSRGLKVVSEIAKSHSGEKAVTNGFGGSLGGAFFARFAGGSLANGHGFNLGKLALSLTTVMALSVPFMATEANALVLCRTGSGALVLSDTCGSYTQVSNPISFNGGNATGANAIAWGEGSGASGVNSTAWGQKSNATGRNSTAFGYESNATGNNSLAALGGTTRTDNTIAIGKNSYATYNDAVAIGTNSNSKGDQSLAMIGATAGKKGDIAIGNGAYSWSLGPNNKDGYPNGTSAIAMGTDANASGQHAIAIGTNAIANIGSNQHYGNIAIGANAEADDDKGGALSDGAGQSVAIGMKARANGGQALAIGANTIANGYASIAIGGDDIGGSKNIAKRDTLDKYISFIGGLGATTDRIKHLREVLNGDYEEDSAHNFNTLEIWKSTQASGLASMAVGQSSIAVGTFANAIGFSNEASGIASNAFGTNNISEGDGAGAYGLENKIYDANGTAVGNSNLIDNGAQNATAIGVGNSVLDGGNDSTAVGTGNTILTGPKAISVGYENENKGQYTLTVGSDNNATGSFATAVGVENNATNLAAFAVGGYNQAKGEYSTAFGFRNLVESNQAMAFGMDNNLTANANQSLALGMNNTIDAESAMAFGMDNTALGEGSIAIGEDNEANENASIAIGSGNNADGFYTVSFGFDNNVSSGSYGYAAGGDNILHNNAYYSMAEGFGNEVVGSYNVALGDKNIIKGNDSIAVGLSNDLSGEYATAIGVDNNITGDYSVAIGYGHQISGSNSGVFGDPTYIDADNAYAIGNSNAIEANGGFVLGNNSSVTGENAVAIGTNSHAKGDNSVAFMGTTADGVNAMTWGENVSAGITTTTIEVPVTETFDLYYRSPGDVGDTDKVGYFKLGAANGCGSATFNYVDITTGKPTGASDCVGANFPDLASGRVYQNGASVVMGTTTETNTQITGKNATAFGYNTQAQADESTAWGRNTIAGAKNSTAFGSGSKTVGDDSEQVIGEIKSYQGREVTSFSLVTYGGQTYYRLYFPDGHYEDKTLDQIDRSAVVEYYPKGMNAVAFGNFTTASNTNATAFGEKTTASGQNSTAFGVGSEANATNSTAFGDQAKAGGENSTAFGFKAVAEGKNSTAFGHDTKAIGDRATAFGIETNAVGRNSTAFGYDTYANGENSVAWGSQTHANGGGSTTFGFNTEADGENSVAWGSGSKVSGEYNGIIYEALQDQENTYTVTENGVEVTKKYYYVIDRNTGQKLPGAELLLDREAADEWIRNQTGGYLLAQNSTAFGDSSLVYATNALGALGGQVQIQGVNSAAIGKDANVSVADTVALGSGSNANRNNIGDNNATIAAKTYKGYDVQTGNKGAANTATATPDNAVWIATANAIAVGDIDKNITRQIIGVAAGSEDTDAVNVAQLKRATAGSTWSVGIDKNGTGTNNGGTLEFGTNVVGAGTDFNKTGVDFIAGNNVDISYVELSKDGNKTNTAYGIRFSAKDTNVTSENGTVIIAKTYNDTNMTTGYDLKVPMKLSDDNKTISLVQYDANGDIIDGNVTLTNVASGVNDSDAVNVSQLKNSIDGNATQVKSEDGSVTVAMDD
ncbi:MAG: hypothetical protein IJ211_02680, partial [Campylobacter sp.]|nr:hypothetical protein [Campylobacter sp.]